MEDFVKEITFDVSSVADLPVAEVQAVFDKYNVVRVTGLIKPELIKNCVNQMQENFDPTQDWATTGETVKDIQSNFHKLSIGHSFHSNISRPRFMRVFYNPFTDDDIFGLHDAFKTVSRVRNVITGVDLEFAVEGVTDGMWTVPRIHQYPPGGGFLVKHRDSVLPDVNKRHGIERFVQILLVMSEKGNDKDFETGGGYLYVDNEKVYFEDFANPGDIMLYNGNTLHGVDDIDANKRFSQGLINGRLSGIVSMYEYREQ